MLGKAGEGYYADGIKRINRDGARLREDRREGEDPRGSDIFEACRLRRGRIGYTRVCECMCSCCLLHDNVDDLSIDQGLNSIP